MTTPDIKVMSEALKVLRGRFTEPQFLPDPIATDEKALDDFLHATDDIKLDKSGRLISFAINFEDRLTWRQICDVYERALAEEVLDDVNDIHSGIFAVWTSSAERLVSDVARSDAERNEIAEGLISVVDRALDDNPENCGFALALGMHYFRESVRQQQKTDYISQARIWLDHVIEWADGEDEQDAQVCTYAILYVAHCHAALGEWERALRFYNAVQIPMLTNDEREIAGLYEGIALCQKELENT